MEKTITVNLKKETPKYFKFESKDEESFIFVYLKKEFFDIKPEKIEVKING